MYGYGGTVGGGAHEHTGPRLVLSGPLAVGTSIQLTGALLPDRNSEIGGIPFKSGPPTAVNTHYSTYSDTETVLRFNKL